MGVTVLAVILAYHVTWIRERHTFLNDPGTRLGNTCREAEGESRMPWSLRLLVERPVEAIIVPESDFAHVRGLFLEVILDSPN